MTFPVAYATLCGAFPDFIFVKHRTAVIIIAGAGAALLLVLAVCGIFGFLILGAWPGREMSIPPELTRPGVKHGTGILDKSVYLTDPALGSVTEIVPQPVASSHLGVAGTRGAVFLAADGTVQSRVKFASALSYIQFVDVNGDGKLEFLNRGGGGWSDASVLDDQGRVLWTYGGMPGVDDMAAGDLDGDGVLDFVVVFNGGGGVRRLDKGGALQWTEADGNVWHVEIVDADGDGRPEIVHSNAGGEITVRDPTGKIVRRAKPSSYFSVFSLCRWPSRADRQFLLSAADDKFWIFDYDGTRLATFDAPETGSLGDAHGAPVRLRAGEGPSFAVIVEFHNWNVSVLYVYGPDQKLVYQEVIADNCRSMTAVPREGSDVDDLLIGGTGTIWKYAAADAATNEKPSEK